MRHRGMTLTLVALATAAFPAGALADSPVRSAAFKESLFELKASNGWMLSVTGTVGKKSVAVLLSKGRAPNVQSVVYVAPGTVTSTRLKADLGAIGKVDVAFKPSETATFKVPAPCSATKEAKTTAGTWTGTIKVTGDRRFASVNAKRASGAVDALPATTCTAPAPDGTTVRLAANPPGGGPLRGLAVTQRQGTLEIDAYVTETRGRLQIIRDVMTAKGAFTAAPDLTTATITPAFAPFAGTGTFTAAPGSGGASGTFTGDISVAFPGLAGRVPLTGAGWPTTLTRE